MFRNLIKFILSRISYDYYVRGMTLNLQHTVFNKARLSQKYNKRELLWKSLLEELDDREILYLEFGVWKGYSIEYFARNIQSLSSKFIGFDSFEGLPENWYTNPKGTFSLDGKPPNVHDNRVSYIKGWFYDTVPPFIDRQLQARNHNELIVHYDADLYSSTLFCLSQMDRLKKPYYAIFDEFVRDETRALYDYMQSHGAEIEFLGHTVENQMLCKIIPHNS